MKTNQIIKSDGTAVPFNPEKLFNSLVNSGAGEGVAREILSEIESDLNSGKSTKDIYRKAYHLLRMRSKAVAGRYKLKRAILDLGPTGYPFEKFVGALLMNRGYSVKVGEIVKGKCVAHEVDVVAENDHDHFMVECKFHRDPGRKSAIQVPLYIQSRFQDIFAHYKKLPGYKTKLHESWIVTNTRFTKDAMDYGKCVGMNLVSWDYPNGGSLKNWIDYSGLHPITAMQGLKKKEKQLLIDNGIILCRDLVDNIEKVESLGIPHARLQKAIEEAGGICGKTE